MRKPFDKHSKQMRVWQHNSYLGSVMMLYKRFGVMKSGGTLTPEALDTINKITPLLLTLYTQLKIRKD